ncbi:MAG: sulfurtransferase [Nitrospira sp.]|nr:sulfurtransferase [Nitrospira sp.]
MEKMLISTQELDELLNQQSPVVLLDARPVMSYLFSHLPGAVNVNWKDFSDPALPMKSLLDSDLARLEKKVGALGVSQDRRVVVYADPFESWGDDGRIYWMLCYLGHPMVQILDGGWFKWKREGKQVERGPGKAAPAQFTAGVNPDLLMTKDELKKRINPISTGTTIIDARTPEEYLGQRSSGLPREGHIPGAVNIPWNSFYNADGTVKSPEEIRKTVGGSGVTGDKEVVTYCTGGVRSAWLYFTLRLAGFDKTKNYAGSWMEWSQDLDLPIEKG